MTKYSYQRLNTQDKQSFLRQEKYARDHDIPTKNWIQEKASGARKDRPKLQELLSILKEGDELYVIDASRLTRSLSQLLLILDLCKERKLKLIMGDFILDCRGQLSVLTQGQIMMLGVLNEMQRLMIVESVNEGLAAAKERQLDVDIEARPIADTVRYGQDADAIMLGPQVRFQEEHIRSLFDENKPIAVIDMKDYGMMNGKKVLDEAIQLIESKK